MLPYFWRVRSTARRSESCRGVGLTRMNMDRNLVGLNTAFAFEKDIS
jgi:hypothetical protein